MLEHTELEVTAPETEEEEIEYLSPSAVYQNNHTKIEENKASAFSLLFIGVIGAVVIVLSWLGKLPFAIGGTKNTFTHSFLFVFFIGLIILGIVSALNVKKYKNLVGQEEDVKTRIFEYLRTTFTKEYLLEMVSDSDEEAYFNRMSHMREKLKENLKENDYDDSLLEALLDEYYDELFG